MRRFSIKSILITTLAIACILAIIHYATISYRQRLALEQSLREAGAEHPKVSRDGSIRVLFTKPIPSKELTRFRDFEMIELQGFDLDTQSTEILAELENIEALLLQRCEIEANDLANLRDAKIRAVLVWNTDMSLPALHRLAEIDELELVTFINSSVTQDDLDQLAEIRPKLRTQVFQVP